MQMSSFWTKCKLGAWTGHFDPAYKVIWLKKKQNKKTSVKNIITLIGLGKESFWTSMIFKLTLTEGALCDVSVKTETWVRMKVDSESLCSNEEWILKHFFTSVRSRAGCLIIQRCTKLFKESDIKGHFPLSMPSMPPTCAEYTVSLCQDNKGKKK